MFAKRLAGEGIRLESLGDTQKDTRSKRYTETFREIHGQRNIHPRGLHILELYVQRDSFMKIHIQRENTHRDAHYAESQ